MEGNLDQSGGLEPPNSEALPKPARRIPSAKPFYIGSDPEQVMEVLALAHTFGNSVGITGFGRGFQPLGAIEEGVASDRLY